MTFPNLILPNSHYHTLTQMGADFIPNLNIPRFSNSVNLDVTCSDSFPILQNLMCSLCQTMVQVPLLSCIVICSGHGVVLSDDVP